MKQDDFIVIILAGGKGTRLYPYTKKTPKVLLKIGNKTILERNIEIVRDKFKKKEVHIIVGHNADEIKEYIGDGLHLGIHIVYHQILDVDINKGLIYPLMQLCPIVKKYFLLLFGDEIYFYSDHEKMFEEMSKKEDFDIFCMIKDANAPDEIMKNYSVDICGNKITGLKEKPENVINNYVGLGTIACSAKVFDLFKPEYAESNKIHFIDLLNQGIRSGLNAYYFISQCHYFNINTKDDMFIARYFYRSQNINGCKKSLIIPAYNEAGTIGYVMKEFRRYVDEIIVMDNQSPDGTAEIAREAGAKVFSRSLKGYGDAIRQGLREAKGDILIITEADLTFRADDLSKLLEYLKDADAVIGTRTNRSFIHDKANMDTLLRLGNILFGKIVSLLWWDRKCRLSDVGCTYRALWRSAYDEIKGSLHSDGPEFSPEMMVEILNAYLRLVEVPVKYHERIVGESKISSSKWHSLIVASRMLYCILYKRIKKWLQNLKSLSTLSK